MTEQRAKDPTNHSRGAKGILIDLDAFVDTRLSLLELIDPRLSIKALVSDYDKRQQDGFPDVPAALFAKLWKDRDARALEKAIPTRIKALLLEMIAAGSMATMEGIDGFPDIYLNTYPYNLTREEARGFLKGIEMLAPGMINVHAVRWAPEDLLPAYVKENIAVMILYDYQHWLEVHAKEKRFDAVKLTKTNLFVPELFWGAMPTQEELVEMQNSKQTFFSVLEFAAKSHIGLKFTPISGFNADITLEAIAQMKADYERVTKKS